MSAGRAPAGPNSRSAAPRRTGSVNGMSVLRRTWRRRSAFRIAAVVYLLVFAAALGLLALGALSNLWSDYQDSPTSTYLLIGVPALLAAVVAAVAAARIWRDR
jgi:hypothetical protein